LGYEVVTFTVVMEMEILRPCSLAGVCC